MNTKLLMTLSSILFMAIGILFSFAPDEAVSYLGWNPESAILFQLAGAMYFGFGMINWTAKANLIGGIYGRPIALGNFTHATIAGLALIKIATKEGGSPAIVGFVIVYVLLAATFGYIFFTHPKLKSDV
jgi:hypothetical protein